MKHCTQSVLHFLDFKCPSMLAVHLVYIEFTVQDRVLLSYIRSVLHYDNANNPDNYDNNNKTGFVS